MSQTQTISSGAHKAAKMAHLFAEIKRFNRLDECISEQKNPRQCFKFQSLPSDMKQKVVAFLSTSDALHLLQTCKSMLPAISLSKTSSQMRVMDSTNKCFRGGFMTMNRPHCFSVIVPRHTCRLHSITFQCDWVDRGWGTPEGKLYIVRQRIPENLNPPVYEKALNLLPFADGRIVAESPLVQPQKTSLAMALYPKPGEVYQIWCHIGGREQCLILENMSLHSIGNGSNLLPDYVVYHFGLSKGNDASSFFHMHNLVAPLPTVPQFESNNPAALYPVPPVPRNLNALGLASPVEQPFRFERIHGIIR